MVLQRSISLLMLLCSSPLVFAAGNSTNSTEACDRRCLANSLVEKELFSPPQDDNCTIVVNITSIIYQMLSFDTKAMEMTSRIKINMEWMDPDLGWMHKRYKFSTIVLPVDKIWIPGLVLENSVDVTVEPYSKDVQVRRDGTVTHAVVLFTTVSCEINLFSYPFVTGTCPVAINGWSQKSCELKLQISDNVSSIASSGGEWQTSNVIKHVDPSQRVYLEVELSINAFGAVVTLILPSVLIMLADLVSFALPFEGGERNSFKVTLVLSFTMFLLILNDHLPNGGNCSPLLHYHFSFCLVCLVVSMLTSIVLTRLSVEDSFLLCRRRSAKVHPSNNSKTQHDSLDQEKDIGVITTQSGDLASEVASLQKIANFLENLEKGEEEKQRKVAFAYRLDRFCYAFFQSIYIIYVIIIISITQTDICKVNNLDFWDNSDHGDDDYDYTPL
ncbi:5-hydroxytryptamine receptor 3A [Pimephales promelas]|uniref:5-hydroxytryptamine receptor 3A n=1 Tax=Pimephales promelas TaxID=90988 RepID=UPI0019558140|nr:5-hydroxytryptamine receptor 3A [Pimephales promelas]KAG1924814.1 5-hydroxytryptamine receptor 3A-like [Pimephales promelas]